MPRFYWKDGEHLRNVPWMIERDNTHCFMELGSLSGRNFVQ